MIKNLKKIAVNNLTMYIIIGQIIAFLCINSGYITSSNLALNYSLILEGQFWRTLSFLIIPPGTTPIISLLSWYILYLMGSNLEHYWGALHYNLYILVAVILTNIASYLFNLTVGTNYYLQSSIFLAFAFLNPNFQVRLFFIIPIKIKWIAIATGVIYLWALIFGGLGAKLLLIASFTNFFIFFSKDIYYKIKYRGKRIKNKISTEVNKNRPIHKCKVCSKNDINSPHTDFRYCSTCEECFCDEHINNHTHLE